MDYTSAASNETKSKQVRASTQYLEINGLEDNTNYIITVMASTSKGYGPASEPIVVAADLSSKSISALTFTNEPSVWTSGRELQTSLFAFARSTGSEWEAAVSNPVR